MLGQQTKRGQHKRQILLCLAGLTPQIVTETLYVLIVEKGERVDEIRVITTLIGEDKIRSMLLDPKEGRFHAFCRDFGIASGTIKFDRSCIHILEGPEGRLEDIRNEAENEHVANQICEIVRKLTEDSDTRLHASVAGGRKTMSVYLTAAMQLFGRADDRLSHVLVSEKFETHPHFFYKPPEARNLEIKDRLTGKVDQVSTEEAEIHLAEIPFIRLRGLLDLKDEFGETRPDYGAFVERAQKNLEFQERAYELVIVPSTYTISMGSRKARLTPREFLIYVLFASFRAGGGAKGGGITLDAIGQNDLEVIFRYITAVREGKFPAGGEGSLPLADAIDEAQPRGLDPAECTSFPGFEFLETLFEEIETQHKNRKDAENVKETFAQVISKIRRKIEQARLPQRCAIVNQAGKGESALYAIDIEPERIVHAGGEAD